MDNKKQVLIVYGIDTEGPLYESLQAKFEMLKELYGIDHVAPTKSNLCKLQNNVANTILKNYQETFFSGKVIKSF